MLALTIIIASCADHPSSTDDGAPLEPDGKQAQFSKLNPDMAMDMEYEFDGPVFDIAAMPNGNILVADFTTVKEIGKKGVHEVKSIPLVSGPGAGDEEEITFINGLEPFGNGNFFAVRSGLDLAVGAALFQVACGNARLVADIEGFTLGDWASGGSAGQTPAWKSFDCEPPGGYTAGPQANPYHLTALSGSEVLIADAAGNSLLYAKTNGDIELVATFGPVIDPSSGDPIVQFRLEDGTPCYVEPVPTAVSIGPDGAYYVSELNGAHPVNRKLWRSGNA